MKKILYILSILSIALFAACSQELPGADEEPVGECVIALTLQTASSTGLLPMSRADGDEPTRDGVLSLNENVIKSVHYFFYPKDGTANNTEKEPVVYSAQTGLNVQNQQTIYVSVSEEQVKNQLFKNPYNDCDVYVIVNLPSGINIAQLPDRKLSTLRKIAVEANFHQSLTQESFVMEGLGVATVIDRRKVLAASGTIEVDRLAAKISVKVKVDDQVTALDVNGENNPNSQGKNWTSLADQMTIEFVNGSKRAVLSGNPADAVLTSDDLFTDNNANRKVIASTVEGVVLHTCEPFYTYPSEWDMGSDEEPYLRIMLPWTTTDHSGTFTERCYYKVILGGDEIKRNTWYDLTIHIGVLGSFENQEEVVLPINETNYFVANWGEYSAEGSTNGIINSEIQGARYLITDKTTFEVYNQNEFVLPFSTSHECEIVNVSCTYPKYDNEEGKRQFYETPVAASKYSLTIEGGNTIKFTHVLDNNILSDGFNFTPVTTTFTIRHKDDPNCNKEVIIIQYPAIYGVEEQNTDKNNGGTKNGDNGFVWVNGYQGQKSNRNNEWYSKDWTNFGAANGDIDGNNVYAGLLVFSISSVDGTNFIIGDPRTTEVDNLETSWAKNPPVPTSNNNKGQALVWATAPAVYDNPTGGRQLKYYYPTDGNPTDGKDSPTFNMIAPKFRIVSAYGSLSADKEYRQYYESAKGRCASYQEDGYPAGRWRLPTAAEFEFVFILSEKNLIPKLYSPNTSYWCAHGAGSFDANGKMVLKTNNPYNFESQSISIRCVYDEWYWEKFDSHRLGTTNNGTFTPTDTFTWGDMPRSENEIK